MEKYHIKQRKTGLWEKAGPAVLCFSGCMAFLYRYISGIMCYNSLNTGISRGGIFDTGFSLNTAETEKFF